MSSCSDERLGIKDMTSSKYYYSIILTQANTISKMYVFVKNWLQCINRLIIWQSVEERLKFNSYKL